MIKWLKQLFPKTRKVFILYGNSAKIIKVKETPAGWLGYLYPTIREDVIRITEEGVEVPFSSVMRGVWWNDTGEPIQILNGRRAYV